MELISYPLNDHPIITKCLHRAAIKELAEPQLVYSQAFVPDASYVSLGASNTPEANVHLTACEQDNISVFKRLSGGEAVFLSSNCVVFSSIVVAEEVPKSADFFALNLEAISSGLKLLGINNVHRRGISDLAIGEKKILGCAIYRKTRFILFQAVLNVCESPASIQRYLKHPTREPDYRKARSHLEFVTSLQLEGYSDSPNDIAKILNSISIKP